MIGRKKDITSGSVPRFPAKPKLANSSRTLDLPKTSLFIALFCSAMAHAQKQIPIEQKDSIGSGNSIIKVLGDHTGKGAANNALDVLSGQAAGVNVTSNGLDRMAMLNSVRVRGTTSIIGGNDPLVLIDGVTSDVLTLSTIYPADIESFRILKNAAETAMYGSRGASGVIEVKTKKGTGRGFQISYEGNVGFEQIYSTSTCSIPLSMLPRQRLWACILWETSCSLTSR